MDNEEQAFNFRSNLNFRPKSTLNNKESSLPTTSQFSKKNANDFKQNRNFGAGASTTASNKKPGHHHNTYVARISLKHVTELLDKKPEEIILKLSSQPFGFENYLNAESMSEELVIKMLTLIEKSFECNSLISQLKVLAKKYLQSNLFLKLVYDLLQKKTGDKYNINVVKTTLNVCCLAMELDPLLGNDFEIMKDRLELMIKVRIKDNELIELFDNRFTKLREYSEKMVEKQRNHKTFKNCDFDDMQPPNDFTEMNIVPNLNDILFDQMPFLRKNLTNGAYENVNHYLDVQFRLLREDYLQPLRHGVGKFGEIVKSDANVCRNLQVGNTQVELSNEIQNKLRNIESLNVYFDVEMSDFNLNDIGLVFQMRMNMEKARKVNWENSKKLMFGSLVCLSSDLFTKECLIGIVAERDDRKLRQGFICIKFEYDGTSGDLYQNNLPSYGKNYIMLEASAYFESYKHVLEALVAFKNSNEDFPFKEHLVDCKNTYIERPKYLKNVAFDFRPIVDSNKKIVCDDRTHLPKYIFSKEADYAEKIILTNDLQWPKAENMKLDESQYNAVRLALEHKLALIQGPPGTGKTFIGVKIVELLLHNKGLWWNKPDEPHRPILMICYTNHALDQFLEYCIEECKINYGVVRVGSRSKSEKLSQFMLRNVKQGLRSERKINSDIFHQIRTQRELLDTFRRKSSQLNSLARGISENGIITINSLKGIVTEKHLNQFNDRNEGLNELKKRTKEDFTLLEWLGLFDIDNDRSQEDEVAEELEKLNVNEDESIYYQEKDYETEEEDDNYQGLSSVKENYEPSFETDSDDEMNQALNNERMLEDDFEFIKKQDMITNNHSIHFEELIDFQDIYDMLIRFNYFHGSNKLSFLIRNNSVSLWQTKTKGKKQKKSNNRNEQTENNHVIQDFINNCLDEILATRASLEEEIYLEQAENIWELTRDQRIKLYSIWLRKCIEKLQIEIQNIYQMFNLESAKLNEYKMQEDLSVMKDAVIIAMTTTGSSRYHKVLKDIGPRIIIVEEAAEVFEAHIVSALSKKCEHLILIGDHVQLRPNPSVYKLAKDFELDVSLFERLIKNQTKRVMLTTQHRMRPEISSLMKHFYDISIIDHSSVLNFDNIIGVNSNIFFINHENLEKNQNEGQSKLNEFEALYIVQFCIYILKQKQFDESKITVLSMYLGQMMLIKRMFRNLGLYTIKVCTVDNYQGEENDIIMLSLVRSNLKESIGFLKTYNRVCVALSRARKGFYCIGNIDLLNRNSSKWSAIIQDVKERNCVGNGVILSCGIHLKNDIVAKDPEDFKLRPDGGCNLPCIFRLKCGHVCSLKCHTFDQDHKDYICPRSCEKIIEGCKHPCKEQCSHENECAICRVLVDKKVEECGHTIKFRCDSEPSRSDCTVQCPKILSCGHQCLKKCGQECGECETILQVDSTCHPNQKMNVMCKNNKFWMLQKQCKLGCNKMLECNHICRNSHSKCFSGYIHSNCKEKCTRTLFCGHPCDYPCSTQCRPCIRKCQNKCLHSVCKFKCSVPCAPCREPCKWRCPHKKCTKECHEICDRTACNKPCKRKLPCNHPCIGFCGEPCPKLCRICNKNEVTEIFFGSEDEHNARFVLLRDCKHIVEYKGMETWLRSKFSFFNDKSDSSNDIQLPCCPKCKTPIRLTLRYSNYFKMQSKLIEQIKLKQHGDLKKNDIKRLDLISRLKKIEEDIEETEDYELFYGACIYELENNDDLSFNDLVSYENHWNIFLRIFKLQQRVENEFKILTDREPISHLNYELNKLKSLIYDKKTERIIHNYGQRLKEILFEINRIECIFSFYNITKGFNKSSISDANKLDIIEKLFNELKKCLFLDVKRFDEASQNLATSYFDELRKHVKFELTKEEKLMIVNAIGLSKGHWFKCKKGHIYCIGDCGGAMEKTVCPECKSIIGGENHALEASNNLASEMDGATRPAWSNQANLEEEQNEI